MVRQRGVSDLDERHRKLSELGDPPTQLQELIDFEVFRPGSEAALKRFEGSKGGRPPYEGSLHDLLKIAVRGAHAEAKPAAKAFAALPAVLRGLVPRHRDYGSLGVSG